MPRPYPDPILCATFILLVVHIDTRVGVGRHWAAVRQDGGHPAKDFSPSPPPEFVTRLPLELIPPRKINPSSGPHFPSASISSRTPGHSLQRSVIVSNFWSAWSTCVSR